MTSGISCGERKSISANFFRLKARECISKFLLCVCIILRIVLDSSASWVTKQLCWVIFKQSHRCCCCVNRLNLYIIFCSKLNFQIFANFYGNAIFISSKRWSFVILSSLLSVACVRAYGICSSSYCSNVSFRNAISNCNCNFAIVANFSSSNLIALAIFKRYSASSCARACVNYNFLVFYACNTSQISFNCRFLRLNCKSNLFFRSTAVVKRDFSSVSSLSCNVCGRFAVHPLCALNFIFNILIGYAKIFLSVNLVSCFSKRVANIYFNFVIFQLAFVLQCERLSDNYRNLNNMVRIV